MATVVHRSILLGALLLTGYAASAQNEPSSVNARARSTSSTSGKQTYIQFCATCHGVEARGNGPASLALKTPPPDLTTLEKRHGGKFPYDYVFDVLRFGTRFAAHGSSDMPIWGPVFASMESDDEVAVRKRIKELSDYLASLQQKES